MATDYAEKERIFVSELKEDTGRDLEDWMQAITDAGLPHRNDIIDWLREKGFTFANASWLERIHANGGRLIYAGNLSGRVPEPSHAPQTRAERPPAEIIAFAPPRKAAPPPAEASTAALPVRPMSPLDVDADVEALLGGAKGLRPLALLALGEIMRILPESRIAAEGPLIVLSAPRRYLALLPGPKALRIYGDFYGVGGERVSRSEAAMKLASKAPPPFPAALTLADARLVDTTFTEIVKTAVRRAHA